MSDLVSVYVITKDRLLLLKRSIDSVLQQTYQDIELIVVDNGSIDGTDSYMKKLSEQNSRLIYIHLSENMGACYARNLAVKMAKGKYITGMDDDDYFDAVRVEKLLAVYKENIHCSFVYGDDGFVCDGSVFHQTNKPSLASFKQMQYQNLVGNQVLSEKLKFIEVGGFDESLRAAQDYDMWLRMVDKYGNALKVNGVTQYVEAGDRNRISTSINKFCGYMQFYRKHKKSMSRSQKKHQILNIKYACRSNISVKVYITLFDLIFFKRKIKVFLTRVLKEGSYGY